MNIKTIKLILLETILGVTTYLSLGNPPKNELLLEDLLNNSNATVIDVKNFLNKKNKGKPRNKQVNVNSLFSSSHGIGLEGEGYSTVSQPLLSWAIAQRNTSLFNALLEFPDIDVCVKNSKNLMPIHAVIDPFFLFSEEQEIKLLKKAGKGKINEMYNDFSPLHYALQEKKEKIVKYLLNRQDLDPKVIDERAIDCAAKFSSLEIFKEIIKKTKIKKINWDDFFCMALFKKNDSVLNYLINEKKVDFKTATNEGLIVFFMKDLSVLKFCLEKKLLQVNDFIGGRCSLLEASVGEGLEDFVKYLLAHKADINIQSTSIGGPLHLAIRRDWNNDNRASYLGLIKLLLENRGLNINLLNFYDQTGLDVAVGRNDFEVVSLLLEHGAEVDCVALLLAIQRDVSDDDNKKIIKALLGKLSEQKGGKIDQRYAKIAVKARNAYALKLLLDCPGIDINYQYDDDSKKSLLHLAAGDGWFLGVKILIEKEAKLDLQDQGRNTPLDLAKGLKEGPIKNAIMKLLGYEPTEIKTNESKQVYVNTNGISAPETARRKGKPGQKTVETESGKQSEKDTKQSLFSETYSTVFSLFPGEKSKQLDDSKYKQGSDVIKECINILKGLGIIEFSFGSNGENHNQLVIESVLNASLEDFYKRTKKPDNIALNHGSNKVCTDHFNETISYLIHFMFVALDANTLAPTQKETLLNLLREFKEAGQLKENELKDLYPNAWKELQ